MEYIYWGHQQAKTVACVRIDRCQMDVTIVQNLMLQLRASVVFNTGGRIGPRHRALYYSMHSRHQRNSG